MTAVFREAYSRWYESNPRKFKSVIVFPSTFFPNLKSAQPVPKRSLLRKAHSTVTMYDAEIWHSSLIIIPAHVDGNWILFAVTNLDQACSKTSVPPRPQTIADGDCKPDEDPVAILALNMKGSETRQQHRDWVKAFFDWHFQMMKGEELQWINSFNAKASSAMI